MPEEAGLLSDPFRPTDIFPRPLVLEWDPARYRLGYLSLPGTEDDLKKSILEILTYRGLFVYPIDAGAKELRGRAIGHLRSAGVIKPDGLLRGKTGIKVGVSDIHGILSPSGVALAIEVKKPSLIGVRGQIIKAAGVLTKDERAFLLDAHANGAAAGVAWSVSDALWIAGLE